MIDFTLCMCTRSADKIMGSNETELVWLEQITSVKTAGSEKKTVYVSKTEICDG